MKNNNVLNKKIFQLKISLDNSNPLIWRRVHVPTNMTLRGLHRVIQTLFTWNSYHLYYFGVGEDRYGDLEFDEYGEMGWLNDQNKRLPSIYEKDKSFKYIYDLGDNWRHTVKIEAVLDPEKDEKYPLCIGGENPAPPDDCGGIRGFYNLLNTISDDSDEEALSSRIWLDSMNYDEIFDVTLINKLLRYRKAIR